MPRQTFKLITSKVTQAVDWWKTSRLGRAMRMYNASNGALLAGGITYKALFSLFAALAIGFTVFVHVLGNNHKLRDSVIEGINSSIPGLIETETSTGILSIKALVLSTTMSVTSIIAGFVLLWSVLTGMQAIRSSIRAMFSLPPAGQRATSALVRSLITFICLTLAILASAITGLVGTSLHKVFDRFIHFGAFESVLVRIGSITVSLIFDAIIFILLVRILAGVKVPRRDMLYGAAITAAGFTVVRFLGTSAVSKSVTNNPLFATGAVLVTILVWLYLSSRIVLTAAAFSANTPALLLDRLESEDAARQQIEAFNAGDEPEMNAVAHFLQPDPVINKKPLIVMSLVSLIIGLMWGRKKN